MYWLCIKLICNSIALQMRQRLPLIHHGSGNGIVLRVGTEWRAVPTSNIDMKPWQPVPNSAAPRLPETSVVLDVQPLNNFIARPSWTKASSVLQRTALTFRMRSVWKMQRTPEIANYRVAFTA